LDFTFITKQNFTYQIEKKRIRDVVSIVFPSDFVQGMLGFTK